MSAANLDLVRSIFTALERDDYSSAEWTESEVEYVIADGPSPGRWKGRVGMAEGIRDWLGAWEDFRVKAEEYRELDDERVLVLVVFSGRGKTSGLEIDETRSKGASLFSIRDGKVTKSVQYWDRESAFADLGLAPEAGCA
jgi:ketosteroid isomerase-like protein